MNKCGHCELAESEDELRRCSRCRSVAYCSLRCQRDSWEKNHRSVCRLKTSLDDEVPLEARDKSWTHEYVLVRDFLRDDCQMDPRELKQLATDEELVHDLYAKISSHRARSKLLECQVAFADASSVAAANLGSRLSSSYAARTVLKASLPPSAAEALEDLCGAGRLLHASSPPHEGVLREAIVSVFGESTDCLIKSHKIKRENLQLQHHVSKATKACASLSEDDNDVGGKARKIKSNQSVISQMEKKSQEYEKKALELSKDLKSGYKEHLSHDKIVADAETMAEKEEETKDLKSRVEAFHGLPADLALAKVALADKKRTLSELGEMSERAMQ